MINYLVRRICIGLITLMLITFLIYGLIRAMPGSPLDTDPMMMDPSKQPSEEDVERLTAEAETLARLGLHIEKFGPGAVAVRETPALLGEIDASALVRDVADEIAEHGTTSALAERIDYLAATMACHGSVRSGRRMRAEEMNALLRQMEATPGSGTCNHGRPTFIELKLGDIEKLFGRS